MSDDYKLVFSDDGSGKNLLDKKGRQKSKTQNDIEITTSEYCLKLRIEKKGRGGKTVSIIDELPNNQKYFKDLLKELKRYCGSGGTLKSCSIEMQGDQVDKIRQFLLKKGFQVKG